MNHLNDVADALHQNSKYIIELMMNSFMIIFD